MRVSEYRRWLRDQGDQGLMPPLEVEYQLKRVACCCAIWTQKGYGPKGMDLKVKDD